MDWFRTKRREESLTENIVNPDLVEKRGTTPTQSNYKDGEGVEDMASPVQVVITTPPTIPAEPRTPRAAGHPARSPSQGTTASNTPSLAKRIRNSVGVGMTTSSTPPPPKGVLRVHHGAVDHSTITTKPPPEVMTHVKEVLQNMGIEIQVEGEFKYRCVRLKKKKGSAISSTREPSTGGIAAINLVGSAGSNGVDKRGLPIPTTPSFQGTGGMLRGLLMRRQSSQVSSSGLDDEMASPGGNTSISSVVTSEPGSTVETIYGDIATDAGDEVRFSVELTKLDRLTDMFSLDIRRLKGNLRSYKFLYDTLRERVDLQS